MPLQLSADTRLLIVPGATAKDDNEPLTDGVQAKEYLWDQFPALKAARDTPVESKEVCAKGQRPAPCACVLKPSRYFSRMIAPVTKLKLRALAKLAQFSCAETSGGPCHADWSFEPATPSSSSSSDAAASAPTHSTFVLTFVVPINRDYNSFASYFIDSGTKEILPFCDLD